MIIRKHGFIYFFGKSSVKCIAWIMAETCVYYTCRILFKLNTVNRSIINSNKYKLENNGIILLPTQTFAILFLIASLFLVVRQTLFVD